MSERCENCGDPVDVRRRDPGMPLCSLCGVWQDRVDDAYAAGLEAASASALPAALKDEGERIYMLKVRPIDGGPWCVVYPVDLPDTLGEEGSYEVVPVVLTQKELDEMGDFNGW